MKTLLEHAKGSPLSILVSGMDSVGTISLLPPYAKQIVNINLENGSWVDIQRFSEIVSEPLPLLRTLNINIQEIDTDDPDEMMMTPPSKPLFSGAADLKAFCLHSEESAFLSHFVFPNLTSFELSVASEKFHCLQLLDFLEASPMLQVVHMKIAARLSFEGIPDEKVVVLHNVETFCLVASDSYGSHELATDISCPSVKHTSLTHTGKKEPIHAILVESFPAPSSLKTIIHQYTRNPIEEVKLGIEADIYDKTIACSLTFLSPDATVIKLRFEVTGDDEDQNYVDKDYEGGKGWEGSFPAVYCNTFIDASKSILDVPLLADVKRFHLYGLFGSGCTMDVAARLGELFRSLGTLEELTICRCDMRLCFSPFLCRSEIPGRKKPDAYPLVRVLTISDPKIFNGDVAAGLVKLAKVQHERKVPFEHVTVRMNDPPAKMEESLRPWVGVVNCCNVPDGGEEGLM